MLYPNMLYDPHIPNAVNLRGFLVGLTSLQATAVWPPSKDMCFHLNPAASTATRAAREKSSNSSPWGVNNLCEVNYMYNYVYSTIWYHISTI